jgi:N-acetylmuramoyl-L-alanine amidase
MVNAEKAAVFVSLHFNAASRPDTRGIETFYPRPTDDGPPRESSALLAKKRSEVEPAIEASEQPTGRS